eukprot:TRINITY_DN18140_c0_g1_i2.p1 TRINITY_DN18140_c0_g1~~TRINITY_DN18140_c0_g1_i2.p1  ORF type:complete len:212 (-),score=19.32 TRINITY_DN18140_c0_g1_i2:410-1045(-)
MEEVTVKVNTLEGELTEVSFDASATGQAIKEVIVAIVAESQAEPLQAARFRLFVGSAELKASESWKACAATTSGCSEMFLVFCGAYDGKYCVTPKWNGDIEFEILGSTVRMMDNNNLWPIQWDNADARRCSFETHKDGTSAWAQRHTDRMHQSSDGLTETFWLTFHSDGRENGFSGAFQRSYEGKLDLVCCTVLDEAGVVIHSTAGSESDD